jgi:alkanesulfonate monooxygenase SsuD/methylene tetrahydromethanopterin reductase-like flavin-dependent oxidoreductase (luciferase family)
VGRQFDEITRSNHTGILVARNEAELKELKEKYSGFGRIVGIPEQVVLQMQEYAEAGSQYITFHLPRADDFETIQLLGEAVLPHIANL